MEEKDEISPDISLLSIVLSVGLAWDKRYNDFVVADSTKYDDNHKPISWAIRRGGSVMSKTTGEFDDNR